MKVKEILESIKYIKFIGDQNIEIERVVSITEIGNVLNAISWCNDNNSELLKNCVSTSVIIISNNIEIESNQFKNYIIVENPRRTFQEILINFFMETRKAQRSPTAVIDSSSVYGDNVFIGHNVVIEANCKIGNNVAILHNTIIFKGTIIGNNVTIGANNTIGGVGFGYEKNNSGDFELIPHIGNVIIKDKVDIGNNTCIDKAVLGSTIIEENVKIDNLVHIAHGVHVGRNSVVIANAMVAGSVNIGENSWIAPSASILNKKNIGTNSLVGLGAVVTKDVEDNTIVAGNPAKFIRKIDENKN